MVYHSGISNPTKQTASDMSPHQTPDASEKLWTDVDQSYNRALLMTGASTTDPSSKLLLGALKCIAMRNSYSHAAYFQSVA